MAMSAKKKEHRIIKEQFGRYLLLDHLVDGGMAKICRARQLGEQAEKIVAIKMIQPQFSQDENFRKMFEDEVKISFALQHPNIAQTYDYGFMNGQLFTAMEYVDGKNLKQYLDELKRRKVLFPIEISVYIISLASQGLHYAHTYVDKLTGKKLNLVHRDISPHNIMLTYDGAVKIIDFGIAKAATNSDATQAGTIKGKLSYLAPEYLEGLELDGRYDEFALGIVLWEMLCSRKLFTAPNELAVLKEIQKCKIPAPSSINPTVPKELDSIVLKALSKDRNQRYEDMDKFNRALTKFLYSKYENFNPSDLGKFATALFKKEIEEDRKLMREFGKIDVRPYLEKLKNAEVGQQSVTPTVKQDGVKSPKKPEVFDFDMGVDDEQDRLSVEGEKKQKTKKVLKRESRGAAPMSSATTGEKEKVSIVRSKTITKKINRDNLSRKKIRNSSRIIKQVKENELPVYLKVASFILAALVGVGIYVTYSVDKAEQVVKKEKIMEEVERVPSSSTEKQEAFLFLKNFENLKYEVFINGKRVNDIVLGEVKIPANKDVVLRIQQKDHKHFIKKVKLNAHETMDVIIPELEPMKFGYLINSDKQCVTGKIEFDLFGEHRVEDLPIQERGGIPLPLGYIRLTFLRSGDTVGVTKEVNIQKVDEVVDICELFLW